MVVNAPELSVTVGSFQDTVVPVLWKGTVTEVLSGQFTTSGASLSPRKLKRKKEKLVKPKVKLDVQSGLATFPSCYHLPPQYFIIKWTNYYLVG